MRRRDQSISVFTSTIFVDRKYSKNCPVIGSFIFAECKMIVIMITVVTRIMTMIIIKPVYKGDTIRQKIKPSYIYLITTAKMFELY